MPAGLGKCTCAKAAACAQPEQATSACASGQLCSAFPTLHLHRGLTAPQPPPYPGTQARRRTPCSYAPPAPCTPVYPRSLCHFLGVPHTAQAAPPPLSLTESLPPQPLQSRHACAGAQEAAQRCPSGPTEARELHKCDLLSAHLCPNQRCRAPEVVMSHQRVDYQQGSLAPGIRDFFALEIACFQSRCRARCLSVIRRPVSQAARTALSMAMRR